MSSEGSYGATGDDRETVVAPGANGPAGPSAHDDLKMVEEMQRIYSTVQAAQVTMKRLEPNISLDSQTLPTSIAISLKRIADALNHKEPEEKFPQVDPTRYSISEVEAQIDRVYYTNALAAIIMTDEAIKHEHRQPLEDLVLCIAVMRHGAVVVGTSHSGSQNVAYVDVINQLRTKG